MPDHPTKPIKTTKRNAPKAERPVVFDHLQKKRPLERTVPMVRNDEVLTALADAQANLADAIEKDQGVDEARDRLVVAETAVRTETDTWRFRSVGRKAFEAIVDAHPCSEDEADEAKANGQPVPPYATESFTVALLVASCVEPVLTEEDAQEIFDEWNAAEVVELFTAALAVNTLRRVARLGE